MNEKLKNNIIEILKSEEAKKYFEDILRDQTDRIVNEIQIQFKNTENDDLQNIKMILDEEISRNKKLKQEITDITSDIENNKKEIQDVLKKNAELVLKLEEKEKYILLKRFVVGKTQMELALELGISQAQISRLEHLGIANVKRLIE